MNQAEIMLRDILERFPQADPESEFFDEEINGCDAVNFISELVPEIRALLDAPSPLESKTYAALQAAWHFIEDVPEDDPERNDKFFALRAQVRDVFWNSEKPVLQGSFRTSWDNHLNGNHSYFPLSDWRSNVASQDTILGYQQWVEHNVETLLNNIALEGVDAIEIAGCTEVDGVVEVIEEADAEFFSIYTRRQGEGVQCECDFNTKAQAIEFAKALAARTGISVYGKLCLI